MAEHDVNPDDELSPEEVAKKIRLSGLDGQYATLARCMVNVQRMFGTQRRMMGTTNVSAMIAQGKNPKIIDLVRQYTAMFEKWQPMMKAFETLQTPDFARRFQEAADIVARDSVPVSPMVLAPTRRIENLIRRVEELERKLEELGMPESDNDTDKPRMGFRS